MYHPLKTTIHCLISTIMMITVCLQEGSAAACSVVTSDTVTAQLMRTSWHRLLPHDHCSSRGGGEKAAADCRHSTVTEEARRMDITLSLSRYYKTIQIFFISFSSRSSSCPPCPCPWRRARGRRGAPARCPASSWARAGCAGRWAGPGYTGTAPRPSRSWTQS